ncbi:hypothetical protein BGW38_000588 [Lunasporangiospora selenospora]|uniref:Protein kinase domain-containing protein n=1 Tax=Lunasporangiospora selenospora TaxID=979761 RepID=A0A9P6FUV8_9FUNG|nr:hypothetical protein BGW38_000588 [Lunasporangiospora selenospora]
MADIANTVVGLVTSIAVSASRVKTNKRTCRQLALECKWVYERLENKELGPLTDPALIGLVETLEACKKDMTKMEGSGYFVRWLRSGATEAICNVHMQSIERWLSRIPQKPSKDELDKDKKEDKLYEKEVSKNLYGATRILNSRVPSVLLERAIVNPDDLIIGQEVGSFLYGTIYSGTFNDQPVLIRKISDNYADGLEHIRKGVILGRCLMNCTNIAQIHGICKGNMIVTQASTHGPLSRHLITDTLQKVVIARKIADAMMFMHELGESDSTVKRSFTGIVHRDIRAANILLDDGPDGLEPKITGFESCKEDGSLTRDYPISVLEDITRWWSPERTISGTSIKSDVFAFGVLMYEISTGMEPERDLVAKEGALVAAEKGQICIEYTDLMAKCLQAHHDARPTMSKIVDELQEIERIFGAARRPEP